MGQVDCRNYSSAISAEAKKSLTQLFEQEVQEGKLSIQSQKPHRVHAIGAITKKGHDGFRPITDCSRPHYDSLNSYMEPEKFSLETFDSALALCTASCFFAVVDLKSAYRYVPVFPEHRQYQGFCWSFRPNEEVYLGDNFLCFGLACAPMIFHRLSSAVARMLRKRGVSVVVYLDNFLVVGHTHEECYTGQLALISLLTKLGFAISWSKVISPTTRVTFLGYVIDSLLQSVELPSEKIWQLGAKAIEFSKREKLTKRELQVILGHMCFAAKAVYGAKTFSRLFIDELARLERPHHRLRVTARLQKEFLWWSETAPSFNGLTMKKFGCTRPVICISTDASLSGFGAVMGSRWFARSWDDTDLAPTQAACNWVPAATVAKSLQKNIIFWS